MSEARDRPDGAGEGVFPGSAGATSEDRLRRAISIETVGVLFFRLDGRILDANAAFERMSGYTVQELRTTTHWETLTPPEFRAVTARAAAELAERGETAPYEKQLLRRDGSRWWGLFAPTRLAGSGRDSECVEFVLDITAAKENEAALRASEERHRQIIEGARDYAIFTTDAEGRIESWSPGAEAVFGWTAGEIVGQPAAVTFTPEDRARGEPEKELAQAAATGSAPDVRWHLRKDGARVFIDGVTRAVAGPGGEARGFLKIGQDVTQRRATEDALRESRERFRSLVQNIRDYAIFLTDARGVVTEWTEGAERVKGYTAEEAVGRHLSLFYTPEEVAAGEVERELGEVAREGRAEREAWRVRKGGERIWVNEITTAIRDGEGTLVGFTRIARDLTDRMRAEERLRELNESLECRVRERTAELAESNRALAAEIAERERAEAARVDVLRQLVTVEEEERRRISRELHDSLGQFVTGLMLGLKALERDPRQLSRIQDLERLADRIAREMQDMAVELRPPALDNLGLAPALRNHLEEWSRRHGVACDFHALGIEGGRLRPEVETTVYRVVQEGLNNVLKHAGASRVSLVLEHRGGMLSAILEDDGGGFDVEATLATPEKAKRLGVRGMRERVALLGGELEIESSPGAGTSVFVRIPAPPPIAPERTAKEFPHGGSRG